MNPTSRLTRLLPRQAYTLLSAFGTRVDMVALIIGVMVTLYALALLVQPGAIFRQQELLLSPGGRALYQFGMTGGRAWDLGWWWTIVTAIYLNGGLFSIVWNVVYTYAIGRAVADVYGHARMFVLFNVAGASGFLLSNEVSGAPTIGGSGALFGMTAGLLLYGRRRGASVIAPWLWWCCVGMIIFLALSSLVPSELNLNGWSNVGGLMGGWVSALLLCPRDESRESRTVQMLQLVLVAVLVVGVGLSFYNVTGILLVE